MADILYEKVSDSIMKVTEQKSQETQIDRKKLLHQKDCVEKQLAKLNALLGEMDKLGMTKESLL